MAKKEFICLSPTELRSKIKGQRPCQRNYSITFFPDKGIHKYTWHKLGDSSTQESLIDFLVIADDLRKNVMDVCVKRVAELSTDHHLVVCKL